MRRAHLSRTQIMQGLANDGRRHARGVHIDDHLEGTGAVPLGWDDLAWDYEQGIGYTTWLPYNDIDTYGEEEAYDWKRLLAENGWEMPCLADECEDWDAPPAGLGRTLARDWDFEPPPVLVRLSASDLRNLSGDPHVLSYERERKAEAKAQRLADEEAERRKLVNEERRNITAMKRAAKEKVLERIAEGKDGKFEVHVRKGNQTLKWEYTIRDGKAFIHLKSTGWVTLAERRGHAS